MKNWGWIVLLVLVICVVAWSKFGFRVGNPAMSCLYSDAERKTETICVYGIRNGSVIKSPLEISGRARGNWYFEASFPIQLIGQNDQKLATTAAAAQGDWMTNDLVPFTATLNFEAPAGDEGKLVFKKDNPSGLPQNDASFIVPIRFHYVRDLSY